LVGLHLGLFLRFFFIAFLVVVSSSLSNLTAVVLTVQVLFYLEAFAYGIVETVQLSWFLASSVFNLLIMFFFLYSMTSLSEE
jgi:hypothetical protein